MKKILLINSLLAITLLLGACSKGFLDRNPKDAYSASSLWSSASDARAALNGCYDGWESGDRIIYMDCASDNGYNQFPWEGYQALGNMQLLTPTNTGASHWSFSTIQRCNWFLENVDKTPMDTALKLQMKAQARFLRAYEYFTNAQLYGDFPLVLKTLTTEEANQVTRAPKKEVMDFVIKELGEIAPNLPKSYSGGDKGRITRGAALALRIRAELFTKDYKGVVADYKKIKALNVYQLFPSYSGLFRMQNENNSGVILDVEYVKNDYALDVLGRLLSSSWGGWSSIVPTQSLVDAYEMKNGKPIDDNTSGYDPDHPYKNRDPRLAATIVWPGQKYNGKYYDPLDKSSVDYYSGNNNSRTGYLVRKFTPDLSDFDDMWNTGLNIIVIRYAEVLLSYAEAKIELNQIDQSVYDAIDLVRNRAGMPSLNQAVYNNQSKMREAIRRERRVEFAMEGLRWYDIQRWKIGDKVLNGTVWGSRMGTVDPNTGALTLNSQRIKVETRVFDPAKNYVWPVPQNQIDVDDKLKQNAGY